MTDTNDKKAILTTKNPEETRSVAADVLKTLQSEKRNVLGLVGDLGAGKTTFVQGLAEHLGIERHVTSPTFMILKPYRIPEGGAFANLIHVDAYRIKSWDEIVTSGLADLWKDDKNLVVIEWADNIKDLLPQNAKLIYFEHIDENSRQIKLG